MRVIFLDIDGVLNTRSSRRSRPQDGLLAPALNRLRGVINQTGAHVVLTSSWRHVWTLPQIRNWLNLTQLDAVPGGRRVPRTDSITEWLYAYARKYGAEPTYVIVDDSDEGLTVSQRRHLVKTSDIKGLTPRHVRYIKARLLAGE